ncbi:MAG: hypothetical protein ABII68_02825 [Pseudomonadota bacterium]
MEKRKKTAAAMAAVMQYIKTEEEAIYMQSLATPAVERAAAPARLWAVSGRQSQMQMRTMMQMRAFK